MKYRGSGKPLLLTFSAKGVNEMAKKVEAAEKLAKVVAAVPVVIWRANRPLTEEQHAELANKLRAEQSHTGVEIMLVPNSVDPEIGAKLVEFEKPAQEQESNRKADADPGKEQEGEGDAGNQS